MLVPSSRGDVPLSAVTHIVSDQFIGWSVAAWAFNVESTKTIPVKFIKINDTVPYKVARFIYSQSRGKNVIRFLITFIYRPLLFKKRASLNRMGPLWFQLSGHTVSQGQLGTPMWEGNLRPKLYFGRAVRKEF